MELKPTYRIRYIYSPRLLIVPYGIETLLPHSYCCSLLLLIVPYGIETGFNPNDYEIPEYF